MIFMGDTHGLKPVFELLDKNKIENKNIIHVGDFGLGFQRQDKDLFNLSLLDAALRDTNNNLYVIRGNHDFKKFWNGEVVLPEFTNLHLVPDDSIIEIENKNIYFSGGAISIDRSVRKKDNPTTWDKDEEFIYNEEKTRNILNTFNAMGYNIDIVVTHSAPNFVKPISDNVPIVNDWHKVEKIHGKDLKKELSKERTNLALLHHAITAKNNLKYWFYGHFHASLKTESESIQYIGLNINELKEIN